MTMRFLLFFASLGSCALASAAAPSLSFIGPSPARAALNAAFRRLLRCDAGPLDSLGDLAAVEQCALIDFDEAPLHAVFRRRRLASSALVVSLDTVDSAAAAVAALGDASGEQTLALVPSAWLPELARVAAPSAGQELLALPEDAGEAAQLVWEALQRSEQAARRLLPQGGQAPANGLLGSGSKSAPAAPPTWAWWLELSTRTQLLALFAFAGGAILLHSFVQRLLDGADAALKAATESEAQLATAQVKEAEARAAAATQKPQEVEAGGEEGGKGAAAMEVPEVADVASLARARRSVQAAWIRSASIVTVFLLGLCLVDVVFDRWRLFPLLGKNREVGTDVFWAMVMAALFLASYIGVACNEKDAGVLMGVRQTEEAKGWMMMFFLV